MLGLPLCNIHILKLCYSKSMKKLKVVSYEIKKVRSKSKLPTVQKNSAFTG